jgi:hypothetical protein
MHCLKTVQHFLIIKPNRCTNYFGSETLHFADSSSVHHQELFTVHSAMVCVVPVCRQLSSSRIKMELQFHHDPTREMSTNPYDRNIPLLCVQ